MPLQTKLRLVWWAVVLTAIPLVLSAFHFGGIAGFCAVAAMFFGAFVLNKRLPLFFTRRALVRATRCANESRFVEAHRLVDELRTFYARSPVGLEIVKVTEGTVLVFERRFVEAVALLGSVDRAKVPFLTPLMLNNLAWALARSGEGARAVDIARESLASNARSTVPITKEMHASQLHTLGAALVVAGKADEALEPLQQALDVQSSTPLQKSAREFYLGEALLALGRYDEARCAWKRAADARSEDLGLVARERLDKALPPYRS